jgi:hypothetical protein
MIKSIDNYAEKIGELCDLDELVVDRIRVTCTCTFKDNGFYQGFSLKKIGTKCEIKISSSGNNRWYFMLDFIDPKTQASFFVDNSMVSSQKTINIKMLKDLVSFFVYEEVSESNVNCFVSSF